ncbi:MAG TPA: metal-dependent transcriptional regulator [Candidatus Krumholzibacteria bacterium]|nr:metal-dependent transcriptional regulator [Candidatus Krumholzibacteria bacterium]
MSRNLSDKLEMYLKTVLLLERNRGTVRVSDIARERGVSAASVTEAITTLQERGFILHRAYRGVRLSAEGRRTAERIEERYRVLSHFLTDVLGVNAAIGARDACEIEHVASPETIDRLDAFLQYMQHCRMNVSEIIAHFKDYYALRAHGDVCAECALGKLAPPMGEPQ